MSLAAMFAPKTINAEEQARRDAQKAAVQRESDLKNPATSVGISVKEAAVRLGKSKSTIYRWIKQGKFQSAFQSPSRAGGRQQWWINGVEVFDMMGGQMICSDSDLH